MKEVVIYETSLSPSDADSVVENVQVTRQTGGSVTIRTIREVMGEYPISISKTLLPDEAELLGAVLLGTHPGFGALLSRAAGTQDDTNLAPPRLQVVGRSDTEEA